MMTGRAEPVAPAGVESGGDASEREGRQIGGWNPSPSRGWALGRQRRVSSTSLACQVMPAPDMYV